MYVKRKDSLMKQQIPVKIGEKYTIIINSLSHNAEGIGRYDGFTIFVPQSIPGDELEVEIISTKKNYARALICKIIKPSPQRIKAKCPVAENCGGCLLQHLSYQNQLLAKQKNVTETLQRVGGLNEVKVAPVMAMKSPWFYRNKASFPVAGQTGNITMGFYQNRSHNIINIKNCAIQHPLINTAMPIIKKHINELKIQPYNEINHTGVIRHIVTRVASSNNEMLIVIVVTKDIGEALRQLATKISQEMSEIKGIVLNINNKCTNVIMADQEKQLYGQSYITDKLLGKQFIISAKSFYQVNVEQTPVLYQQAINKANLQGNEIVVDAYCGTGTIGLILAEKAQKIIGVEIVPAAINDAKKNAKLNNITNAEFHVGKAEKRIPELVKKGLKPNVVVVDPPRKGCDEALLQTISEAEVERIVYVSCNPATLARDLKFLVEQGYKVEGEVGVVDMFPHSGHVESVVGLVRD